MFIDYQALAAGAIAMMVLTAWRPAFALAIVLGCLPLTPRHPSTAVSAALAALVWVFLATYAARRPLRFSALSSVSRQPILVLAIAFCAAAVASLASMPLGDLTAEYLAAISTESVTAAAWRLEVAARVFEYEREFSFASTAHTVQAVALMLVVFRESHRDLILAKRFGYAIAAGATVAAVLGLAEFAGTIELSRFRGSFAVFARPGSVQSTAGNPGWFTEAMVFALPYGLLVLGASALRRSLFLGFVGLTLTALALGFQRGGWVAGAVVTAWLLRGAWRLDAIGRSSGRAGLLVALGAVAVSFTALVVAPGQPRGEGLLDVGKRVRAIASADRWPYWQAAGLIWMKHPILGGGHESFAYRYRRYFDTPGGVFESSAVRVPMATSAHSVYMQTLSGTGIVGLALLVAWLGTAVVTAWQLDSAQTDRDRRVLALAAGGSLLGVAVYGVVQEVFYVPALRLLCYASLGLVAATGASVRSWPRRRARWLAAAVAGAALTHAAYEYALADPERLFSPETYGLWPEERDADGEQIHGTHEIVAIAAPEGAHRLTLDVRAAAPFVQRLQITACEAERDVVLEDPGWRALDVPLENCRPGQHVRMTVRPAWRRSPDGRLSGVVVRRIRFD